MSVDVARAVADAVLWEGYLLYPYRADSAKNQIRWQFGVLGPPQLARSGIAEDPTLHCECLLRGTDDTTVQLTVRFLQLVRRQLEVLAGGGYAPVDSIATGDVTLLSFDEAAACELSYGPFALADLRTGRTLPVVIPASVDLEDIQDSDGTLIGRTVRSRHALIGTLQLSADVIAGGGSQTSRLCCTVSNAHPDQVADRDAATAVSMLGTHLLLQTSDGSFVSLLEPPPEDEAAAKDCRQSRCWPVLAGAPGETNVMLASPIILYDYPAVAPESAGALFDSTEIDEILTLRVMTLTDDEKAAARATDPAAAAIIDRCDAMTPQTLARLHGALRSPHAFDDIPTFGTPNPAGDPDAPWWDPGVDASVSPTTDAVMIAGVRVAKGSLVRLRPNRRADAQDLFYDGQQARVTSVYSDVDDNTHVAVVLTDDPAADLHEWYGRFLYFAPDELQPLALEPADTHSTLRDRADNYSRENRS
jgi:hypothetical protein